MSQKEALVSDVIDPSSNIIELNNIRRDVSAINSEFMIHPGLFTIDTSVSEYIPACFIDAYMFNLDIEAGDISSEFKLPIIYVQGASRDGRLFRTYSQPNPYTVNLHLVSTRDNSQFFNNGLIMNKTGIIFGCFVRTDFIKNLYREVAEDLAIEPLYKAIVDNDVENHDEIIKLVAIRIKKSLDEVDYQRYIENMVVYSHKESMQEKVNLIDNLSYRSYFGQDSVWSSVRLIEEDLSQDWFNSKVFAKPEAPSFNEIDGPERLVKQVIETAA